MTRKDYLKRKLKFHLRQRGYAAASYNYLTNEIFVGHKEGILGANGSALLLFKNNEPITSFQTIAADDKPFDPSNIASISVVKNEEGVKLFGPTAYSGVVIVNYKEPETGKVFPSLIIQVYGGRMKIFTSRKPTMIRSIR